MHLRKGSDFFFQDAVFSAAPLLFRGWTPILYAISWIWLAPMNAGHFVVDPICGREKMKCEWSVKTRHLPSGQLSVAGQKH